MSGVIALAANAVHVLAGLAPSAVWTSFGESALMVSSMTVALWQLSRTTVIFSASMLLLGAGLLALGVMQ